MKTQWIILLLTVSYSTFGQASSLKTENLILITLDGMRWQEVFSGAEKRLITKKFVHDTVGITKKFWQENSEKRRALLMPFVWNTIAKKGQLYGNRTLGSFVNVSNNQWFSYPGYNEIITGSADNERIHSNDTIYNPNKNVLEFINQKKGFEGKVGAFTSWEIFPWILNNKRNGIYVNAGQTLAQEATQREELLNELLLVTPGVADECRLDAFTFLYAMEYLKKKKPRVLYLSFGETDDFAHEGKYDHYLISANNTDKFIASLWTWLQQEVQYKNKTTIMITVDHGRGNKNPEDWKNHGSTIEGADQIWFAVLGPDTPALGEVKNSSQLFQNQIAKTLAAFLGFSYVNQPTPGEVVTKAIKK